MSHSFSEAVKHANENGKSFKELAENCNFERSSSWWHQVTNPDFPTPPSSKYIPGIARSLEISERRVNEMIAEQWYGVIPQYYKEIPVHLRPLIASLSDADPNIIQLVTEIATAYKRYYERTGSRM